MKLYCVSSYRSARGTFTAGQVYEVTADEGAFLCRDSPGSWSIGDIPGATDAETVAAALAHHADNLERQAAEPATVPGARDRRARGGGKRAED